MARTWGLIDTLATKINTDGAIAQNASQTTVYFYNHTGQIVYSWSPGAGLVDISGSTFTGTYDQVVGIAYFQGSLYVAYTYTSNDEMRIARWTGGQSWEVVWTVYSSDQASAGWFAPGSSLRNEWFESDADRLAVLAVFAVPGFPGSVIARVAASTDGTNFAMQTINGADGEPPPIDPAEFTDTLYGSGGGSGYSEILGFNGQAVSEITHNSGNDWLPIIAPRTILPALAFLGYGAGHSFYRFFGDGGYQVGWSDDWGATEPTPAGIISSSVRWTVRDLGTNRIMTYNREDNQAYTWNSATEVFDTDGTVGASEILKTFFVIDGVLYALSNHPSLTESYIYSDGEDPPITTRFYYGTNALIYRSDLPMPGVLNPDGLAVRPDRKAAAGSRTTNAQMIAQASPDDDYANWDDLTESYPTNKPVKALRDI